MKSEFVTAITQLAAEKGVPREMVMEAIQQALVSAYKQHFIGERRDCQDVFGHNRCCSDDVTSTRRMSLAFGP